MWRISVNIILLFQMESTSDARNTSAKQDVLPVCAIVLGMAGSGKTTFVKQLIAHLESQNKHVYSINLDPAVHIVPYRTNIDIRDTVKFKEVMKQYGFGPNGAIMTSLNFFSSQFNKVVDLINKNAEKVSYVVRVIPSKSVNVFDLVFLMIPICLVAHVCSDECVHNEAETTSKLAMGPLGPHKPKRAKTRRRKQQLMLVDMAGDYDQADQDAMADLDGVEQRDSSDETEEENETKTDPFDEKFRRLCSVSSRGADQKPDHSDVKL
ncbi:GPN-loop GTPase 1 [Fasciola gigantica]|uniref:GPN-loop GTPase n=1 Tax=Fasciola gigantica TaxID=46835 RepID=A0A504YSD2_FASGI|nr:GPN-loop GTPase 1 [Fasciola gigantica]